MSKLTPIDIVTDLCAHHGEGLEAIRAAIRATFTPATVWENVGMSKTIGPEEAIALLGSFERSAGLRAIDIEMLSIAAQGNRVLTERIDRLIGANGREIAAVQIMGIFEVEGGSITAWRDYFDTAALQAALQAAFAGAST